jgi:hypothetical protein
MFCGLESTLFDPSPGTKNSGAFVCRGIKFDAGVAQLVEHYLAKVDVTSSSLVTRSKLNTFVCCKNTTKKLQKVAESC